MCWILLLRSQYRVCHEYDLGYIRSLRLFRYHVLFWFTCTQPWIRVTYWSYILELSVEMLLGGNVKLDVQFCTRCACNLEYEDRFVCVTCVIRPVVIAVLLVRAHRPCFRVAVAHDMIGGANSYARVWPCKSCLIFVVLSSRIRFFVSSAVSDRVVVSVA